MTTEDGLGKPSLMTKDTRFAPLVIALAHVDPKASLIVRSVLDCLGCRSIVLIRDGEELIARTRREHVDLAVVDSVLRTTNGIEAVGRLRRDLSHPRCNLPVILLLSDSRHETVRAARDAGADEIVLRPFNAKHLLSCVYQLIERPRPFVIAPGYIGPDRRSSSTFSALLPAGKPGGLRSREPKVCSTLREASRDGGGAVLVPPDYRLKLKMGLAVPDIVAPSTELLRQVERQLTSTRELFACDVERQVGELLMLSRLLIQRPDRITQTVAAIRKVAGWIEVFSAELGYARVPDVARLLLDYCNRHFVPDKPESLLMLEKHALTLMALLRLGLGGAQGAAGEGLLRDLARQAAAVRNRPGDALP